MPLDTIERLGRDLFLLILAYLVVRYLVLPFGRLMAGLVAGLRQINDRHQLRLEQDRAIAQSRIEVEQARQAAETAELEAIAQLPPDQLRALALRGEGIRYTRELIAAWGAQQAAARSTGLYQNFPDFVAIHCLANKKL